MNRALAWGAIAAITLFSFFAYPGHAWLDQDTLIYAPILEHEWSGVLSEDLLIQAGRTGFTYYNELTLAVRALTRLDLQHTLQLEQLLFRALGFWAVWRIAIGLGAGELSALAVTFLFALGGKIAGPEVLTVELEPVPRAFAIPLVFAALAMLLERRGWLAALFLAGAILLHAPSTWPVIVTCAILAARHASARKALSAVCAVPFLLMRNPSQPDLFSRLPAWQESLMHLRTAYDFVSQWWWPQSLWYLALFAVTLITLRRHRATLLTLFTVCLFSLPLSFLLLELAHSPLGPELQPARALLFLTAIATISTGVAALQSRRHLPWLIPALAIAFAFHQTRSPKPSAGLAGLAQWARTHPGVYAFPDSARSHDPAIFRAIALQPVYVDWKTGGQLNYSRAFAEEWKKRWTQTTHAALPGVDYIVLAQDPAPTRPIAAFGAFRVFPAK